MVDMRKWESKKIGVVIEVDYDPCSGIGRCVERDQDVHPLEQTVDLAIARDYLICVVASSYQ